VVVENAGVEQFVLELFAGPTSVRSHQFVIGVGALRILVEVLHVRVGGRAIYIEVVLLHVLAVIALAVGQAEKTLFQNWILAITQGEGKAEPFFLARKPGQPVFPPAIGAGAGLVVTEVVPGIPVIAIVFPHRSPLALAQIGSPFPPWDVLVTGTLKPPSFSVVTHSCSPFSSRGSKCRSTRTGRSLESRG